MRFQTPANPAVLRGTVIYSLSVAVLLMIRSQGNSSTTASGRFLPVATVSFGSTAALLDSQQSTTSGHRCIQKVATSLSPNTPHNRTLYWGISPIIGAFILASHTPA
jgi:hypothetical protein